MSYSLIEAPALQFTDLPLDVLSLIFDKLSTEEKIKVRKTSKVFRKIIDMSRIKIEDLNLRIDSYFPKIDYDDGRLMKKPMSHILNEFKFILNHPKLEIGNLKIEMPKESEVEIKNFQETLKSMGRQLEVRNVDISSKSLEPSLAILPYLKPGTLEEIQISLSKSDFSKNCDSINQILNMEQWKQAQSVALEGLKIPISITNFFNFKKFRIEMISLEEVHLEMIRDILLPSSEFHSCHIDVTAPRHMPSMPTVFPEYDFSETFIHTEPETNQKFEIVVYPFALYIEKC